MPIKAKADNRVAFVGIESVEGTPIAASATNVILTRNLQEPKLEYDSEIIAFNGVRDLVRDQVEEGSNLRWINGFECPITTSGVLGSVGALSPIIRACGFDQVIATTGITYRPSVNKFDSLTIHVDQEKDATKNYRYSSAGCRGQLGIELNTSKRSYFKVTNLTGSYIAPLEVAAIVPDYQTQKASILEALLKETVTVYTYAGKSICAASLIIENLSGADVKRTQDLCSGGSTTLDPVTPVAKLQIRMPDWLATTEFNPWVIADVRNPVRYPLVVEYGKTAGKIFRLEVLETQATKPRQVKLPDNTLGMEFDLRLLSPVLMTFK